MKHCLPLSMWPLFASELSIFVVQWVATAIGHAASYKCTRDLGTYAGTGNLSYFICTSSWQVFPRCPSQCEAQLQVCIKLLA